MLPTTLILLGGDQSVASTVRKVVTQTRNCAFAQLQESSQAMERIRQADVALVLIYLRDVRDEAIARDVLTRITREKLAIPALVLLGESDPELTLRLLKLGAVDCLPRPINVSRLAMLIEMLTVRARYAEPEAQPRTASTTADPSDPLANHVMVSPSARRLMDQIRLVAPLDSTILLTGETGTGKTSLARVIHALSPRCERPFLVVNCGALSPTLIESEMFGHAQGAFTGAQRSHTGKFEDCQDGTLFLDEIDSLPLPLQAKLLRAVEERLFEPVGSNRTLPLRARLIAATNQSLEAEVAAGRFRADLYFRLNVVDLIVPALREGREAIPHLVDKLLAEFTTSLNRPAISFSPRAYEALLKYDWPGNIRELRNVVERAVILSPGPTIDLENLPAAIQRSARHRRDAASKPEGNCLAQARHGAETEQLVEVLQRYNNNRSHAAAALGISRVTLYKKLHKYGLS